jgi:hypothetical protein
MYLISSITRPKPEWRVRLEPVRRLYELVTMIVYHLTRVDADRPIERSGTKRRGYEPTRVVLVSLVSSTSSGSTVCVLVLE